MPIHRKQPRLSAPYYRGFRTHFVTVCCDLRHSYLSDPSNARLVQDRLLETASRNKFLLHAYCLMPDHLHLLVQGINSSADLREFIRVFKLRTAFEFRKATGRRLWEMSYYDHILRSSDSIERVACYIWWNPVRQQLCATPLEFPYSGSQTVPWATFSFPGSSWFPPWKPAPM